VGVPSAFCRESQLKEGITVTGMSWCRYFSP